MEIGVLASIASVMTKTLLQRLPAIVDIGRQEAERILESCAVDYRGMLDTCEWVLPVQDNSILDWIKDCDRSRRLNGQADLQQSLLICGDSLTVMAALLAGDDAMPSLRGKIDLIHINPPLNFREYHQTGSVLPGMDAWVSAEGIALYLSLMTPRLILMRKLLSNTGVIYMRVHRHVRHYAKVVADALFGSRDLAVLEWPEQGLLLVQPDRLLGKEFYRAMGSSMHKPAYSLESIIRDSTHPESIIADFFGGCSNTAAIAERLGRRWIASDIGKPACMELRKRLIEQNAQPFLYQTVRSCHPVGNLLID